METRKSQHFDFERLVNLCQGNTAFNPSDVAHMRECQECEDLFLMTLDEARARRQGNRSAGATRRSTAASSHTAL